MSTTQVAQGNDRHVRVRAWPCELGCAHCCCCRVNLVLVGAEGVVENGGIINKLGSYHVAIAAKEHGLPFYVAAESYKVELQLS